MYTPNYRYSDKLVSDLVNIERQKTLLQARDLSYNIKTKLFSEIKAIDIFHLASILGIEITLKDSAKITEGARPIESDEVKQNLLINYKNSLEFSRSSVADTYPEVDINILKHFNKLIITQWRESWEARFRHLNDVIDDSNDKLVQLRDRTIPGNEIEKEVSDLVDWFNQNITFTPPLVRIAVLLYKLIDISPFIAANELTFIALLDFMLIKNNLGSRVFTSTVRFVSSNEEKFKYAFEASKRTNNISTWIEVFVDSYLKEIISAKEFTHEFIVKEEKSKEQPFLNLNKRQLKVLKYLQTVPTIKREDYCHMMDVSTMTAFRDLKDLGRKKLVKTEGQGRGTKYKLASM